MLILPVPCALFNRPLLLCRMILPGIFPPYCLCDFPTLLLRCKAEPSFLSTAQLCMRMENKKRERYGHQNLQIYRLPFLLLLCPSRFLYSEQNFPTCCRAIASPPLAPSTLNTERPRRKGDFHTGKRGEGPKFKSRNSARLPFLPLQP